MKSGALSTFVALSLALPSLAAADEQEVSLLGLTIGKPLTFADCSRTAGRQPCTKPGAAVPVPETQNTQIYLSPTGLPDFLQFQWFIGLVIKGRLESLSIFTTGPQSQNVVMEQLKAKFGEPATAKIIEAQNAYGAKFPYIDATWHLGTTDVRFRGVSSDLKSGTINVISSVARAKLIEMDAVIKAAEPRL